MTEKSSKTDTGLRDKLPLAPRREPTFRWRGAEVSRVEGLADGVFAFAVTLLVVALEVPTDFEGLLDVVRGFPAFVLCFALLMSFWNAHYRYHRRFGLEDVPTRLATMAILVLVLFFVYPLKFLFTMLTVILFGLAMHDRPHIETIEQMRQLYTIYGLGFAGVWGLYAIMYVHAYRQRVALGLDAAELLYTRAGIAEYTIFVAVCLLSVGLALFTDLLGLAGYIYFLLGPLQALSGWRHGRRIRALP